MEKLKNKKFKGELKTKLLVRELLQNFQLLKELTQSSSTLK
jgi:hypothetical protein